MNQSKHQGKVRQNDSQNIQASHSLTYKSNKWHHSSTDTKSTCLHEAFKARSLKYSKNILNIHLTTGEYYMHCVPLMCLSTPQLGQTTHWHLVERVWPDVHARQALLMSQAGPSLLFQIEALICFDNCKFLHGEERGGGLPAAHVDCSMQWHACLGMKQSWPL